VSVIFSKSCEYAFQAVLYLASRPQNEPILLREVSDRLDIPHHFLSKVLQTLSRDGIVTSYKGATGGFVLGRSPKEIKLIDIVRATDGEKFLDDCVLGFPGCGDQNPCSVHHTWKKAKKILLDMLNTKNVAQLSKEIDAKLELVQQLAK